MNRGPLDLQSNALPLSYTPFLHNGFSIPYFKCVTTPKRSIATVNSIHSSPPLKLAKPPQTDWSPFSGQGSPLQPPRPRPCRASHASSAVRPGRPPRAGGRTVLWPRSALPSWVSCGVGAGRMLLASCEVRTLPARWGVRGRFLPLFMLSVSSGARVPSEVCLF